MSGTVDTSATIAHRDDWVRAWPLNKPALIVLAKGAAVLLVAWSAIGLLYMAMLDDGPVGDADRSLARSLEDSRTPTLNTLSHVGSMLSDTLVKVILVAVVGGAMVIVWRRWHDGVFLALAVSLEASVFVIVSFIVDRDRPPVVQLDPPAPSGKLPVRAHRGGGGVLRRHLPHRAVAHDQPRRPGGVRGRGGGRTAHRGRFARLPRHASPARRRCRSPARHHCPRRRQGSADRRCREDRPHVRRLVPRAGSPARPHHWSEPMTSSTFTTETGSRKVEEIARRHPSLVTLCRLGWVAKGVVYLVVGILAIPIAIDGLRGDSTQSSSGEASQTGAVAKIAETSFGTVTLWVIAIGLALYVLWRLISIVLPADNTAKAWLTRLGYLVSALTYSALAWTAVQFAQLKPAAAGAESEDAKVERYTRELMEKSGGRWLVGAIGVVLIGVGLYFLVKGLRATFRDELEPGDVGPFSHETIVLLGRVGWAGRGVIMGLIGWFLLYAAIKFRPDEAKGFDGALRDTTSSTLGALLVGFAAVALVVYGLFCAVSAPRQRLTGAD